VLEEVGTEGQAPGWNSPPGGPGSPWSGMDVALERLPGYMASFSLWEHLLSFISVSWIYRITLVSARRETHLGEPGEAMIASTQNHAKAGLSAWGQARLTQSWALLPFHGGS
jgi:hypothetical protein